MLDENHDNAVSLAKTDEIKQFLQIASYHLGRLFTYSLIGLLFGLLGKGFYFFGFQPVGFK